MDSPNSVCSSDSLMENNSDYCEIEGIDKDSGDNIQNMIHEFEKMWMEKGIKSVLKF